MNIESFFNGDRQKQIGTTFFVFLIVLTAFFVFKTINEIRSGEYMSREFGYNTISVTGEGEAFAIPDTASFSFSVTERASTVAAAQDGVSKRMETILTALREAGVAEEDIKTTNYAVYPRYEYQQNAPAVAADPAGGGSEPAFFPQPGREVLVGYEVVHTNEVKLENTETAGTLLSTVGSLGATNVSGLSFVVEDESAIMNEARTLAIEKAKQNAEVLADELGVRLVKLVSFYEEYPGGPVPYYGYGKGGDMDMAESRAVDVPVMPGEHEFISRVNLTYEIR